MKKLISLLILTVFSLTAWAQNQADTQDGMVYTPATVPNVQLEDRNQYVTDPAGYMSGHARDEANKRLAQLRDSSSVEMAIVILPNIGNMDIFDFSQKLATRWGIGKRDKNNGMLVLFDMGDHQVRIHPGKGMEGIFTDVACTHMIREQVIPNMKTGDIDDAVLDLVDRVQEVLTDPEAAAEVQSAIPDESGKPRSINFWYFLLIPIIGTLWIYSALIKHLWRLRGKSDFDKALDLHMTDSPAMDIVLCIITLGLGIPAVLIRRGLMRHYRNKPRKCDVCGTQMEKLPEDKDNAYLSSAQDAEEKLNSVDYDVWLCPHCHATEIFPFPNQNTPYTKCPNCGAMALHLVYSRVERPATTTRKGVGVKVYECVLCLHRIERKYNIPIKQDDSGAGVAGAVLLGSMMGRGGGGFGGGGGSIGGGFGGGSFGGGGASGSW